MKIYLHISTFRRITTLGLQVISGLRYPWQQKVLDASGASRETLSAKIGIAEQAIAARLRDPRKPDAFERLALTDALRALEKPVKEAKPKSVHHYHIRWSSGALDWERFITPADAEAGAKQLALPNERYTIEEHGEECSRCGALMKDCGALMKDKAITA
jgi:hypothetical protein